jgi:hypothetical protein
MRRARRSPDSGRARLRRFAVARPALDAVPLPQRSGTQIPVTRNRSFAVEFADVLPAVTVRRIQLVSPQALTRDSKDSMKWAVSGAEVPALPQWVGTLKVLRLLSSGGLGLCGEPTDGDVAIGIPVEDSSPQPSMLCDAIKKLLAVGNSPAAEGSGGIELKVGSQRAGPPAVKAKLTKFAQVIVTLFKPSPAVGTEYPEWDGPNDVYRPNCCAEAEYDPLRLRLRRRPLLCPRYDLIPSSTGGCSPAGVMADGSLRMTPRRR